MQHTRFIIKGFTLIEMLFVILVFGVGILTILQFIIYNLSSTDNAKQTTIGTILAKEGLEIVYNMRDSNLSKSNERDCVTNNDFVLWSHDQQTRMPDICNGYFKDGISLENSPKKILQTSIDLNGYISTKRNILNNSFLNNYENNILYLNINKDIGLTWMSHNKFTNYSTGNFARYIQFDSIKESDNVLPIEKIIKITSKVLIGRGIKTGEIILESFIGNY